MARNYNYNTFAVKSTKSNNYYLDEITIKSLFLDTQRDMKGDRLITTKYYENYN